MAKKKDPLFEEESFQAPAPEEQMFIEIEQGNGELEFMSSQEQVLDDERKPFMDRQEARTRLESVLISAREFNDSRRVQQYQRIASSCRLDVLFDVNTGLRQPIVDMIYQSQSRRFSLQLSPKAERLVKKYKAVFERREKGEYLDRKDLPDNFPAHPVFKKGNGKIEMTGMALSVGPEHGQDKYLKFHVENSIMVPARYAIFLWANYGSSYNKGKPLTRMPSCRNLVECAG